MIPTLNSTTVITKNREGNTYEVYISLGKHMRVLFLFYSKAISICISTISYHIRTCKIEMNYFSYYAEQCYI